MIYGYLPERVGEPPEKFVPDDSKPDDSKPDEPVKQSPIVNEAIGYQMVRDLVYAMGIKDPVADWVAAQAAYESANFTSNVGKKNNNWSGIKYINKPYQKNAVKGTKSPDGDYYARYATWQDWAKDLYRILHLGGTQAPVYAVSLADYVHRLKKNKYFSASEANYLRGLQKMQDNQKTDVGIMVPHQSPIKLWWQELDWKWKAAMGVGVVVIAVAAVRGRR